MLGVPKLSTTETLWSFFSGTIFPRQIIDSAYAMKATLSYQNWNNALMIWFARSGPDIENHADLSWFC